jgi:hypothetical protein
MGLGAIVNGLFMLVAPVNWYFAIPGVTNTGPFNQHFIRDIGMTYAFVGAALITGAWTIALRVLLWTIAASWLSAHALFHSWEVVVGICGPSQLATDFPGVFLPAFLTTGITAWAWLTRPKRYLAQQSARTETVADVT